jgi:predicted CXXCH cytochrome family protein
MNIPGKLDENQPFALSRDTFSLLPRHPAQGKLKSAMKRLTSVRSIACLLSRCAFLWMLLLLSFPAARGEQKGYVGSEACAQCHKSIYEHYVQTSMGRSMAKVSPAFLKTLSLPAHTSNPQTNRRFDIYQQDNKLYQSEYEIARDGSEIFRDTHEIEWIIGAGTNGFGGIVQRDDHLFQSPQSFYSRSKSWAPSPGYEQADLGFNRPIQAGCIFCHSGQPRPVENSNGQFENPPFAELSVGCENCHGPGSAHIAAMRSPHQQAGQATQIVNPSRLTPYLADNICMSCHQTGDVRVLKPGKSYQDFRPGEALDKTLAILLIPPTRSSPPNADHTEHYYSMTLSKCYRASQGRMSCITCHDPHTEPAREDVPAYFDGKCLTCHTTHSCKLPLNLRQQSKPADNCIGCHMPKRDIQEISHSSATNHRIVARADEPFPDITFQQTMPSLPDLIHLNPAPGENDAPPPLLTLLEAYGELAANHPEYVAPYLKVLAQLESSQPQNALVQASIGRRELKNGNFQAAVEHLQLALKLDPSQASTYADLSEAMAKLGQAEESLPFLEKAVSLDEFNPIVQKNLVVRLIQLKQYAKAQAALEHYLEIFPQDTFMRQMLARAEGKTLPPETQ